LDCDPTNVTFTGSLVVNQGVKLTGVGALNVQGGNFTNNGFILSTNTVAFSVNNGTGTGVAIPSGQTINNFVNTETITGVIGVWNNLQGKITTLNNTGRIDGGINNDASVHTNFFGMFDPFIATLNNLQGASIGQPLKYSGLLGKFSMATGSYTPLEYNIIIRSPTDYGMLEVYDRPTTPVLKSAGVLSFNIDSSSTVTNGTYKSVLIGLAPPRVANPIANLELGSAPRLSSTSGTFGVGNWLLQNPSGSTTTWDLILSGFPVIILGPSAADTQQSLVNVAGGIKKTVTQQNTVMSNNKNYSPHYSYI
jgi:hypothetical protein